MINAEDRAGLDMRLWIERRNSLHREGYLCERKRYSFCSMAMLFFSMSFLGWLWEVCLHLITNGCFVNRGFFHGPWLPIYGFGSLLILTALNKLRKKPWLEFLSIIILCGCIEYFISWALEQIYDGMKWWDYSDYFLNLNGRICAEGLLAFGAGGMLIVYLGAPFLDEMFGHIPKKVQISVCLVLTLFFCIDLIYSCQDPNIGNGIAGCWK